jgi:mono/diheme cytochrome c family protein
MRGNSTVRNPDAGNLLISMLDGIDEQAFPGLERMQEMPGFAGTLNDAELAQLANYLRAAYGGQEANLTAADVAALQRKEESAP